MERRRLKREHNAGTGASTAMRRLALLSTIIAGLATTLARVAEELHHQYLLGFSPSSLDGKTHKLEVQTRDPALTVRARKTYIAAIDR